jgi:stage II sporulation protein D
MERILPIRHMPARVALAVVLAATGLVLAAPVSEAGTIHVPDHATLTIKGHGWGNGFGMSQYGARGAAAKGLSAQQIVRFYYPHTRAGQVGGSVKVLIEGDTDHKTTVLRRSGLKVHDLGRGGRTLALPTTGSAGKADQWRLAPAAKGATEVAYRHAGWHVWRTLPHDAEFRAAKPITLVLGSDHVTYRGSLQSRTPSGTSSSKRVTVDKVSLEAYVQGVVASEMPASWSPAALRAQAIAARSYAAFEVRSSTNPRWNLCDSSHCQVYGGLSAEQPASNAAVSATRKQVRMFHGAPAFTQFGSSDGGWTADGGKPYLLAQRDPYEKGSGNPFHSWTAKVSSKTVESVWPSLGNLTGITVKERDGHGQWNGRVVTMTLHGSKGDVKDLSGETFRSDLGLRSTWFTISVG